MSRWLERLLHRKTDLDAAEAYGLWAPNYPPCAHNPLMVLEENAVLQMFPDLRGATVLDLACGSGRYLKVMMQRGVALAVGLDASMPMLARAREFAPTLVQADIISMGLRSGRFHFVACALALGHVKDLHGALREISRVMAPQGALIYSDFHPAAAQLGWKRTFRGQDGHEYAARYFSHTLAEHTAACTAAGLRIAELREPSIDFDHKWRGRPALLIVRAVKTG